VTGLAGARQFVVLLADGARLAWHRRQVGRHGSAYQAAADRHRARVVAWIGHDPDPTPTGGPPAASSGPGTGGP
jgi:hypothetical protein